MKYYNRESEELDFDKSKVEFINNGWNANVYKKDDIIFKEYSNCTGTKNRLKANVFDILKDIDSEYLMKIFDIYNRIKYENIPPEFIVDFYTAKFYQSDDINPVYESKEYLLDNFKELEKLFDIFTDNGIITSDVKNGNTIITKDNIVLIDPDLFSISNKSKREISVANKLELLKLFTSICSNGSKDEVNKEKVILATYTGLSCLIDEKTDVTSKLSKKLEYVKKPIDYLKK